MNRRTLFRTLAGALCAPLVKWLPQGVLKEERRLSFQKGVVLVTSDGMWTWTPSDDSVQTITFNGPFAVSGQEEA